MKKKIMLTLCMISVLSFVSGCSVDEVNQGIEDTIDDATEPEVTCTVENQYRGDYDIGYYIEGTCTNDSNQDYDYLQVELICYDADGNNLGTAMDNTNNLLSGQTWKFNAMALVDDATTIDHCDYHQVTGW